MTRKQFLSFCATGACFVGLTLVSYPFIASWAPNPRSSDTLDIDISALPADGSLLFEWQGKPAIFYKPGSESKEYLVSLNNVANGPDYNLGDMPDFFIYVQLSTYLGCHLRDTGPRGDRVFGYIGYQDPCHRGFWDKAGRLLPSVHAGEGLANLQQITDYIWISDTVIRIEANRSYETRLITSE